MIKQYCKVALRSLARQKVLALINVCGLSIGLACFIVFLLYAVHEFSYDRFHQKATRIYRVIDWTQGMPDREPGGIAGLSMGMGPALAQDFPDVEHVVRFRSRGDRLVKVGDRNFRLGVSYADAPFFSVFSFPLLSGSAVHALDGPGNIVLTKDMARQLFGSTDVLGKIVQIKSDTAYDSFIVTGVAENLPSNSIFNFGLLIGYPYLQARASKEAMTDWTETWGDETFVLLRPGSTLAHDVDRLVAFRSAHMPGEGADLIKNKLWNGKGIPPFTFRLQPLRDIHTNTAIDGSGDPVDPKNIWLLIAIASGVLLIACINFTTLSIGRSAGRAREIGVRRIIGSKRSQLVWQFLSEAFLLTLLSAGVALGLVYLLLPSADALTGTVIHGDFRQFPELWWMLGGLVCVTALLAGTYPALVLSGFKPLEVLKSKVRVSGANFFTRSLVVIQFLLSAALVTVTVVILQQLAFLRSKNLGFTKENVIDVSASGVDTRFFYPLFRQALQSDPRVLGITSSEIGLGGDMGNMGSGYAHKGQGGFSFEYPVEPGYLHVMGMHLIEGRDFDARISSDSTASVVVNEALLDEFHISRAHAIGEVIDKPDNNGKHVFYSIIGVISNFNFSSLSQKVGPQLFLWPDTRHANHIYVRVAPGDPSGMLSVLGHTWKTLVPGLPFQYHFLDEEMNRFYESETKWSRIIGWAGGLSICLACLGLFGLAALVALNRQKELGIRKVLGASVTAIVRLLSVEFSWLVGIALVLAIPLAWYFTHRWLQGYAYHIAVSWWVFAVTGVMTLAIALITVSFHAVKAALSNPVESLRAE